MVPRHHPVTQMTIASSNFRTPAAIPDCITGPGRTQHGLVHPSIHLYLHCQFPKFHLSVFTPLSPHLLLFLQAPHYPLSAFLTHSPISHCLFNLISFFLLPRHLLLPFANVNIFFFDLNETPRSTTSTDLLNI